MEQDNNAEPINSTDNVAPFVPGKTHEQTSKDNRRQLEGQRAQLHNLIEQVGGNIESLINGVASYTDACAKVAEDDFKTGNPNLIIKAEEDFARLEKAAPQNWVDISNLDLRRGLMALRRALYQTTSF